MWKYWIETRKAWTDIEIVNGFERVGGVDSGKRNIKSEASIPLLLSCSPFCFVSVYRLDKSGSQNRVLCNGYAEGGSGELAWRFWSFGRKRKKRLILTSFEELVEWHADKLDHPAYLFKICWQWFVSTFNNLGENKPKKGGRKHVSTINDQCLKIWVTMRKRKQRMKRNKFVFLLEYQCYSLLSSKNWNLDNISWLISIFSETFTDITRMRNWIMIFILWFW